MKNLLHLLFIFGLFISFSLQANAYKIKADRPAIAEKSIRELDLFFLQNGYDIYRNEGHLLAEVDRLYVKNKFREKVIVKIGAYVEDKTYNKLLIYGKGYLSNLIINGKSNVIYFSGYSADKATGLKSSLNWVFRARSTWSMLFLPRAEASTSSCKSNQNDFFVDSADYQRLAIPCLLKGAQKNSGNNIVETGLNYCNSTNHLDENESECASWTDRIFSQSERNFEHLMDITGHLGEAFTKAIPHFKHYSAEKKAKLTCELVASIGAPNALRMASGPGSLLFFQRTLSKLPLTLFKNDPEVLSELKAAGQMPDHFRSAFNSVQPNTVNELNEVNRSLVVAKEVAAVALKNLQVKEDQMSQLSRQKRGLASISNSEKTKNKNGDFENETKHLKNILIEAKAHEKKEQLLFIRKYKDIEKKIEASQNSTNTKQKLLGWTSDIACPMISAPAE